MNPKGFISFRIDWFDLLAVQGTLKSLLQHHNSKPLILQLSLLYGPTFTSNTSVLKYWNFNISPSNEYAGLISFRIDWFDLLAVQGTLKSLLQYHSSKASILWRSTFFTVQLLHPYMATGKTIALTRRTLVGKVMSLLYPVWPKFRILGITSVSA